jgi:spore coat protein JB
MSRDEMLKKLTALDFYIIDLHLYLNTHPSDKDAIMKYNAMVKEASAIRQDYQEQYGMLMAGCTPSKIPWQWIDNPWPWQYKFNFDLAGEDK